MYEHVLYSTLWSDMNINIIKDTRQFSAHQHNAKCCWILLHTFLVRQLYTFCKLSTSCGHACQMHQQTVLIWRWLHSFRSMGGTRELAFSAPSRTSTIFKANSKHVPGPLLVISLPSCTTRSSEYWYPAKTNKYGKFTSYRYTFYVDSKPSFYKL